MKNLSFFILICILPVATTFAQTVDSKPQKIRHTTGLFSEQYELGDKDVTEDQVSAHLEKSLPSAYYDFKRGSDLTKSTIWWNIIGISGLVTGIVADGPELQLVGYGVSAISFTFSFVNLTKGGKKKGKAIKAYNQHFGY